jgi:hypothetical protein
MKSQFMNHPPSSLLSPQLLEDLSQQHSFIHSALSSFEDDLKVDKWLLDQLKNSLMEKARYLITLMLELEKSGNIDSNYAAWEDSAPSLWSLDKPDAQWMPSNVNRVSPDRLQQPLKTDSLHEASVKVRYEDLKADESTTTHDSKQIKASLEPYAEMQFEKPHSGHVSRRHSTPVASPSGLERDKEETISASATQEAELPHTESEIEPHEDSKPGQSLLLQSDDTKKDHHQLGAHNGTGFRKFKLVTAFWGRISHLHLPSRRDSAVETNIKEQR